MGGAQVDKFAEGLIQTMDNQHSDDVENEDKSNAFARFKVCVFMTMQCLTMFVCLRFRMASTRK